MEWTTSSTWTVIYNVGVLAIILWALNRHLVPQSPSAPPARSLLPPLQPPTGSAGGSSSAKHGKKKKRAADGASSGGGAAAAAAALSLPAAGAALGAGAAAGAPAAPADAAAAAAEAAEAEENAGMMREVLEDYLERAEAFRADLGDKRLTVEHMVLAMAEDPRFGEVMLCAEAMDTESIKKAIRKSRVLYNRGGGDEPVDTGTLAKFSRELTSLAAEGRLDPVIGRHGEMRRLIDVLGRRSKNSAVLIGEPGVGKTAIVHGLAQRIAAGDVPAGLAGARLVELELGLLMAGATFPGEFEERLRGVLAELSAAGPAGCVLFIDDVHAITGPNAQQGGGVMDASVLLKPLLARGEVRVVGCTSADKYRKFIEKDPGLERRFQLINIDAPGVPETISILRGLRHKYQEHHGVRITDAALAAAAALSDAYLPDRQLPDKALDLIDEASAKVKTDLVLKPEALDKAERRIRQLEAERKTLLRVAELDAGAATDLAALEDELVRLAEAADGMRAELEASLAASERTQRLQDDLDRLDADIEAAEEAGEHAKAEQLRKARRGELIRKLRHLQRRNTQQRGGGAAAAAGAKAGAKAAAKASAKAAAAAAAAARAGGDAGTAGAGEGEGSGEAGGEAGPKRRAEVTEADVARIISAWTGIPLTKLVESEASRLLHLTDELHRRIIGQHEAVVAVSEAIHRSRAGMKDPNGPIASFLFLGPTGVGKTELAKALAAQLFNSEQAMVRLDMSEYMEKHAVAKLIGAPPGYVGYDEGGQLTEQVRRRPYAVILFDEVEKAHVDVFNLLLQLLDDGRVTDSQGRVVSFKNAIIIMTSNLGSAEIFNATYNRAAPAPAPDVRELVMERVRKHFQPEFLNRIDEFICFEPLNTDQIARIVELQVAGLVRRVADKRMSLDMTRGAIQHLARVGYDPVYGARPVKRAIQRELETPLAQALLRGQFQERDTIVVEAEDEQLRWSRIPAPPDAADGSEDPDTPRSSSSASGADSAAAGARKQPQARQRPAQAQPPEPIPIAMPQALRHASSSSLGGAAAGSSSGGGGAASKPPGAAGSSSRLKYDPLGSHKGGKQRQQQQRPQQPSQQPLQQPLQPLQQQQQQLNGGPPDGADLARSDSSSPPPLCDPLRPGSPPPLEAAAPGDGGGGSGAEALSGLSPDVLAHLDPANLPAFLKPPTRRDGQDDLPTRCW